MKEITEIIISVAASVIGTIAMVFFALGKKANQLDTLSSDVKDLKTSLKTILDKITGLSSDIAVLQAITKSGMGNPNCDLAVQHSPLALTEIGKEVSRSIKAEEIFKAHKKQLYAQLDQNKLKNAYDIQKETFLVVRRNLYDILTEAEMKTLKDVAYNRGDLIDSYLVIFQILLRDDVLKNMVDRNKKLSIK